MLEVKEEQQKSGPFASARLRPGSEEMANALSELRKKIFDLKSFLDNCAKLELDKNKNSAVSLDLKSAKARLLNKGKEIEKELIEIKENEEALADKCADIEVYKTSLLIEKDRQISTHKYELIELALAAAVDIEQATAQAEPKPRAATLKAIAASLSKLRELKNDKDFLNSDTEVREFCELRRIIEPVIKNILSAREPDTRYQLLLTAVQGRTDCCNELGDGRTKPPDWDYIIPGVPVEFEYSERGSFFAPQSTEVKKQKEKAPSKPQTYLTRAGGFNKERFLEEADFIGPPGQETYTGLEAIFKEGEELSESLSLEDEAGLLYAEKKINIMEDSIEAADDIVEDIKKGAIYKKSAHDLRRQAHKTSDARNEDKRAEALEKAEEADKQSRELFLYASEKINEYKKYLELNQFVSIFNEVIMPAILISAEQKIFISRLNKQLEEKKLIREDKNKLDTDNAIAGLKREIEIKKEKYEERAIQNTEELFLLNASFKEGINIPYLLVSDYLLVSEKKENIGEEEKESTKQLKKELKEKESTKHLKKELSRAFKSLIASAIEIAAINTSKESASGESQIEYEPILTELSDVTDALNDLLEDIELDRVTSALERLKAAGEKTFKEDKNIAEYMAFLEINKETLNAIDLAGGIFSHAASALYDYEPESRISGNQIKALKKELEAIDLAYSNLLTVDSLRWFILPTSPKMEVEELKARLDRVDKNKKYYKKSRKEEEESASDLESTFETRALGELDITFETRALGELDIYESLLHLDKNIKIIFDYVSYGLLGKEYFIIRDLTPDSPINLKKKLASDRANYAEIIENDEEESPISIREKTYRDKPAAGHGTGAGGYVLKKDGQSESYLRKLMEKVILNDDVNPETNLYKFSVALILKEIIENLYNRARGFINSQAESFKFVPDLGSGGIGTRAVVFDAAFDTFGREKWTDEDTGEEPLVMRKHLAYKKDQKSETGYSKVVPEKIKGFEFTSKNEQAPVRASIIGYVYQGIVNKLTQLRAAETRTRMESVIDSTVEEKPIAPGAREKKVSYIKTKVTQKKQKTRDFDTDYRNGENLNEIYNILKDYVEFITADTKGYVEQPLYDINEKTGKGVARSRFLPSGKPNLEPITETKRKNIKEYIRPKTTASGEFVFKGNTESERAASEKKLEAAKEKYKYTKISGIVVGFDGQDEESEDLLDDTDTKTTYIHQSITPLEIREREAALARTEAREGRVNIAGELDKDESDEGESDEDVKDIKKAKPEEKLKWGLAETVRQNYKGREKLGVLAGAIYWARTAEGLKTKEVLNDPEIEALAAAAGVKLEDSTHVNKIFDPFVKSFEAIMRKAFPEKAFRSKAEVEADLVSRTAPKPKNLFDLKAKDAPSDDRSTQVPEGIKIYLVPTDKNAESLDTFNEHIATLQEQLQEGAPLELCESMIDFLEFLAQAIRAAYTNTKTGELDIRVSDILDKINEYREALENIEAQKPITSADVRKSLNREVLRLLGSPQITSTNTSNDIKYLSDILYRVIVYPVTEDPFRGETLGRLLYYQGATLSNRVKVAPGVVSERIKNPGGPKTKINMLGFLKARLDSVTPFIRS